MDMNYRTFKMFALAGLILAFNVTFAAENVGESGKVAVGSNKTTAADCEAAESQFDLEINNVRARLLNGGDVWWNLSNAQYEVPKIDPPGSAPSVHSLFAGALWISGIDGGGNLKIAAQTYRQGGDDFWPGPINDGGSTDRATCRLWDEHFNVFGTEIDQVIALGTANGYPIPLSGIPQNVQQWPGKGNPYLLAEGIEVVENMAPFFDFDGDGIYDPANGDYPVIDANPDPSQCGGESFTYADQMVFWVYNDVGNIHTETGGLEIGLQVNALAFAFQTSDEINDMTFYRYTLVNKSGNSLSQTYMGQWVDPDLGCFNDDFVGCDTSRDLGIVYNGDPNDDVNGCGSSIGYGETNIPILGIDYFEGPLDTSGRQLGMSSFVYYNNDFSVRGNPRTAAQFRNYQTGRWIDGTNIEFGGDGYNEGTFPFEFMFPSSPDEPAGPGVWSECSEGIQPADRRFLQNSGPFVLLPGAENNITVGAVWVQTPPGTYPCPSFTGTIGRADDKAQDLFDNCFKLIDGPDAPTLRIRELKNELIIYLVNEAGSNNIGESYDQVNPLDRSDHARIRSLGGSVDSTFTFQGYRVYQLANQSVSAAELDDRNKAREILQVDINDGIDKIINQEFNQDVLDNIPVVKVDGNDNGIIHSFRITEDAFADGNPQLVNHRTYYFAVVSYAHNEYTYTVVDTFLDPGSGNPVPIPTEDITQDQPYLQGRRNFSVYSAIPHIPDPRNAGTELNSAYGDGVQIIRVEGSGNGGFEVDLTDETVQKILNSPNHRYDTLVYKPGLGPINVKVIDPMKVQNANFELVFIDTVNSVDVLSPTAYWRLTDITDPATPVTIFAERDISRVNEQIIEDYGISVTIGQPVPVYPANPTDDDRFASNDDFDVYGHINTSITFTDTTVDPWLLFLEDQFQNSTFNWIRCGDFGVTDPSNNLYLVFNDNFRNISSNPPNIEPLYHDPESEFETMGSIGPGGRIAPYCLAAQYADPNSTNVPFVHGPGFKWFAVKESTRPQVNNLNTIASVDIVLTSDRSLWSKCIVFETGEDDALNEGGDFFDARDNGGNAFVAGNARKGQIRMALSVDKNGNNVSLLDADTGRSWFPGYAINVETGERLNIAFGEASNLSAENGNDMVWNPTANLFTPLNAVLFGGKHFIYVFNTPYDSCSSFQERMLENYNRFTGVNEVLTPVSHRAIYEELMYTCIPYLAPGYSLLSPEDGLIPDDLTISIRVEKPYAKFPTASSVGDSLPHYFFSTQGLAPEDNVDTVAVTALDLINVVPNPYYAYSSYEINAQDNRIKITNLPNECTVSIFSIDGVLIRQFRRAIGSNTDISDGTSIDKTNLDNSIDWDLRNQANVPISSGIYYIHVEAPGIGEQTVKFFAAMRPIEVE